MQMFAWKHGGTGNYPKRKQHKEHSLVEWLKRVYILIYIFLGSTVIQIFPSLSYTFIFLNVPFSSSGCGLLETHSWNVAFCKKWLEHSGFSSVFQITAAQKEHQHVCMKWRVTPNIKSWLVRFSFFVFSCRKHFAWSSKSSAGQQLMSQQWRRARLQHFPG